MIYHFGQFALDTGGFALSAKGEEISVEPQVFALLQLLIENRDRVLTKDEIIEQVWDGRIVSDGTLNSRINAARRALGDDGKAQAVIKTFPRRGFRFIAEVSEDEATARPPASPPVLDKPSIAVLPFSNLSSDPEQEFFADGISEDIITALSHIRHFFVIARGTTFTFKGQAVDVQAVARDLGVRYVLEGSVRKAEDRVRITVQLIDGETGNHIWAERYDRDLEDIFALQDEITETVVGNIEPELSLAEQDRAWRKPPDSLDAWELFHRGLLHIFRRTKEDILAGRDLFEKAIEQDPNFAGAHAGLAWACSQDAYLGSSEDGRADALRAAERAVKLDNRDAFAHVALGQAHASNGQMDAALADYEEALRLNPSYALARSLLGSSLSRIGRAEEAIPHLESAIQLSPSHPGMGTFLARVAAACLYLGRHQAAVEWGGKAVQKNAPWTGRIPFVSALGHLGRDDEARAACADLRNIEPDLSIDFVQRRVLMPHQPYMDHLLEGLRKAGLAEN